MRDNITRGFGLVEDVLYVSMGALLAFCAGSIVVSGGIALLRATLSGVSLDGVVALLDRTLLVLMLAELLYTVRVSFREHSLLPEPFLIVGLIAATRRIIVVTAEFSAVGERSHQPERFRDGMIEIGILTLMVVAMVGSLLLLRKRDATRPVVPPDITG